MAELSESDMVTTACCAMRRPVFEEVGRFHPELPRGVDPELRKRVREPGYRIAVVPNQWHYHPAPDSWRVLLSMAWRNGAASAWVQRKFPEAVCVNPEGHGASPDFQRGLASRALGKLSGLARQLMAPRWHGATYDLVYALGYFSTMLRRPR